MAGLTPDPVAAGRGPVRVVTVDPLAERRRFLRAVLDRGADVDVVGEARSPREALDLVGRLAPGVVVVELAEQGEGLSVIELLMARRPVPILAQVAAGPAGAELGAAALAAGAVDVVERPGPSASPQVTAFTAALRDRVRLASRIPVISHPRGRMESGPLLLAPESSRRPRPAPALPGPRTAVRLIVVGASTGGPAALAALLGALPADLSAPVLVVQHIAPGFLGGLASWLDATTPLAVHVGRDGEELRAGVAVLAPEGTDSVVEAGLRLRTRPPGPGQRHAPAVDAAFRSAADAFGAGAVGVLLTGMGRDGAAGLACLRRRGAVTLAQDEATCAVFGMPAAARDLGAVAAMLPLDEIGPALARLAGGER